jgi:hypothetical protein
VDAGTLVVRDVIGLNPIGHLPALGIRPPQLPDSGVAYVSNMPAEARVAISGGTVLDVRIGGQSTGLTSGMFPLSPGESIAVVYSSPPVWRWFLTDARALECEEGARGVTGEGRGRARAPASGCGRSGPDALGGAPPLDLVGGLVQSRSSRVRPGPHRLRKF